MKKLLFSSLFFLATATSCWSMEETSQSTYSPSKILEQIGKTIKGIEIVISEQNHKFDTLVQQRIDTVKKIKSEESNNPTSEAIKLLTQNKDLIEKDMKLTRLSLIINKASKESLQNLNILYKEMTELESPMEDKIDGDLSSIINKKIEELKKTIENLEKDHTQEFKSYCSGPQKKNIKEIIMILDNPKESKEYKEGLEQIIKDYNDNFDQLSYSFYGNEGAKDRTKTLKFLKKRLTKLKLNADKMNHMETELDKVVETNKIFEKLNDEINL